MPDKKFSHSAVNYGPGRKDGDHCAICQHYRDGPRCTLVAPPIQPSGWCELFKGKSK